MPNNGEYHKFRNYERKKITIYDLWSITILVPEDNEKQNPDVQQNRNLKRTNIKVMLLAVID